jgi:amino acid adenylation domain-containing protein
VAIEPQPVEQLTRTIHAALARHPGWNIQFSEQACDLPLQRVVPYQAIAIPSFEVSGTDEVLAHSQTITDTPMPLLESPLFRAATFTRNGLADTFFLACHHAIADGWSIGAMAREIASGRSPRALSYLDYLQEEAAYLDSAQFEKDSRYWEEFTRDLPSNIFGSSGRSESAHWALKRVPDSSVEPLKELARQTGTSLMKVVATAIGLALHRLYGRTGILLSTAHHNRWTRFQKMAAGNFANPLLLPMQIDPRQTFRALLAQVDKTVDETSAHAQCPYDLILREHLQCRDPIDIVLLYNPNSFLKRLHCQRVFPRAYQTPLCFVANPHSREQFGQFEIGLHYQTSVLEEPEARALLDQVLQELSLAVEQPDRTLCSNTSSPTLTPSKRATSICDLIAKVVDEQPSAIALQCVAEQVTYSDLWARAGRLAAGLVAAGVRPETRVGLLHERSLAYTIALLGVFRSGGVTVTLDPDSPLERLEQLCRRSQIPILLSSEPHKYSSIAPSYNFAELQGQGVVPTPNPAQLAYIIFTSGTTGLPKPVGVQHGDLASHCLAFNSELQLTPDDCVLQFTSFVYDVALEQLLASLVAGTRVVLRDAAWTGRQFLNEIKAYGVTVADLPPSYWLQLPEPPESLRVLAIGGDRMPAEPIPPRSKVRLLNAYGPTEAVITATIHDVQTDEDPVPIGRILGGRSARILNKVGQPLPAGMTGELALGGCLARGYLNAPAKTAERFRPSPSDGPGARQYLTGDQVRQNADGVFEFLGRQDRQVKIRGVRLELSEIENLLRSHPKIDDAYAMVRETRGGELIAYVVTEGLDSKEVRAFLRSKTPESIVPAAVIVVPEIPRHQKGDLSLSLVSNVATASTSANGAVADCWKEILELEDVDPDTSFFDLGGNSLLLLQLHDLLEQRVGQKLGLLDLMEAPTIRAQNSLLSETSIAQTSVSPTQTSDDDIAIVGLGFYLPGASDPSTYWDLLSQKRCAGKETDDQRSGVVNRCYEPEDIEDFDADLFSMTAGEAELTPPGSRLLMECGWMALESAGFKFATVKPKIGIFMGLGHNDYVFHNLSQKRASGGAATQYRVHLYNSDVFAPTRLAYSLDSRGPAVSVTAACATSLVTLHQAGLSLLRGECDWALCGGATVLRPHVGYSREEGMPTSPDGFCRPFDEKADGTVFGSGAGVLAVRRARDAIRDKNPILAIVKGTAMSNDGGARLSYLAPGVEGQVAVIQDALARAGASPDDVGYVETHGTATQLGDPLEVRALSKVWGSCEASCSTHLGSVKGNVGHLDAAAGAAALIKTVLCLAHRKIPGVPHFQNPNPKLEIDGTAFRLNQDMVDWPKDRPLAGVSGFGIGGTNCHVVLAPGQHAEASRPQKGLVPLVLSARSEEALKDYSLKLADWLAQHPTTDLADLAYTLCQRRSFKFRRAYLARDISAAIQQLRTDGEEANWPEDHDWESFFGGPRNKVFLPVHCLQRTRHWIEPAVPSEVSLESSARSELSMEERITRAWEEVLGFIPEADVHLFEAGGDSLAAIDILGEMRNQGIELSEDDYFDNLTIQDLAKVAK